MAFDAFMMRACLNELASAGDVAKIEKVYQPQNDEIDLGIRLGGKTRRLVFNVGPNAPRLQLSDIAKENPEKAPMLCMLLRKHITGGRIVSISQPDLDRIADLTVSAYDEMGFPTEKHLIAEIMGKYANLILTDKDYKIITAMKLVDFAASTVRQILPGLRYTLPEQKPRLSPLDIDRAQFDRALAEFGTERTVEKFITSSWSGIATQIAHELCYRATGGIDTPVREADIERLYSVFSEWQRLLISHSYTPTVATDSSGKPIDYSYMNITYLEGAAEISHFDSISALLDAYFAEKDRVERIRQRAHDLITLLNNATARTERKLALQREALLESENGELYKRRADLITANIYRIKRGDSTLVCLDYYDESCPEVTIELDTRLSPSQNAQRLYKLYNKSKTAKAVLTEQIAIWEKELVYLESVRSFLDKAECEDDLAEIREELYRSGYSSRLTGYRPSKKFKMKPMQLKTSGGFTLLVGRNNIQNEYVTFKLARGEDIWFHVKDMPGSHVVLVTEGTEPGEEDYTEAAQIAAYYSKATAAPVAVDYTRIKYVKKVSGAKPGFVIYKTNYTAYVTPRKP
ncbi:MAG: NFACT family protein [Clostridia bacterium]|nr:NFACT family protein [Clostridia bacterium]